VSEARLDALYAELPRSRLPAELVAWLRAGIEAHHCGIDLAEGLGLDSDLLDRRDDLIRMVIPQSRGDTFLAQVSYFLSCLDGEQQHHSETVRRLIHKLQRLPVPVPRTAVQLRNITQGNRAGKKKTPIGFYGWGSRK